MPIPFIGGEQIVLTSPLSAEECMRRLRGSVRSDWATFSSAAVLGKVGDTSFRIRKRPSPFVRNSFQTHLYARVERLGSQTQITCRIGMNRFIAVFTMSWFAFVLAFASVAGGATLFSASKGDAAITLAISVGMGFLGTGLVRWGRFMSRGDRSFLLAFLRTTIDAEEPR